AFLAQALGGQEHYRRAVHFLEVLETTRCPGYDRDGWGYPFDWETKLGTIKSGTPLITTLPYVYEAFRDVYAIDKDDRWHQRMQSIAEHARLDYRDVEVSPRAAACTYTPGPDDPAGVVNASAYRAALLTMAAVDLAEPRYGEVATRNIHFIL